MQLRYHDHGLITEDVRSIVDHEIPSIERHFTDLTDDQAMLDVSLEHHLRDDSYTAKLVLLVPDHVIPAHSDSKSKSVALRTAFSHLRDRVDEVLATIRHEPEDRREGKFHVEKAAFAAEANETARRLALTSEE